MNSSPPKSCNKYKKIIAISKSDTIGDFKIGAKIGQGTFSKVCMGIHIPTGEKVAIKILPKNQIKEKTDKIRIEKEINIQKKLHHQNIIHQYSVLDTEDYIYIISEYCSGGELFDYIVSKRHLPEVEACRIFQQLINGLEYLHKQKICHRDLKPENLLFDAKKNLKIADFGLSNEYLNGKLGTPCGSPCYAAPEMVTGQKYMGDTVDIWSSGIVLYSMVCGYLPFEDEDQTVLFHKIAKGLFTLPGYLSYKCKDLIKNILVTNPNKRYGFEEIKKHPWFMSVNNISGKNNLFNSPGIIIDYDVIPIDINIIKEMYYAKEYKNFSISNIISDIIRNRHNKITTGYYLILKRKLRRNGESVSNINSNSKLFIEYMKKPISKMSYWDFDYEKIIAYYTQKAKEIINIKKDSSKNKKNNLPFLENDDIIIYKEQPISNKIKTELSEKNNDTNREKEIKNYEKINIKKNNINDTEDDYYRYKLTNYELDSDEIILKEINNNLFNKKQINEILKTNNTIEEKENKTLSSESSDLALDKIIKETHKNLNLNRNKKNEKKRNNSVIEVINKETKQKNSVNNNYEKNNLSNDKIEKGKYVYNNINIANKKIKVYKKEKINNNISNINNKFDLSKMPNNSYLYKKIQSLIVKEDKANKFINKKKKEKINKINVVNNKINQNLILNNEIKYINNYKKINNKRLQTQETKNNPQINNNYINNYSLSGTNSYKDSKVFDENNNRINNNIKIQNINNYIIDVHKYKINLIGNTNNYKNMNLIEFHKKINNLNRYNKFISSSNKKNYIQDNKNINNNSSNEKNKKKSKIRHLSDMDIPSNKKNFISETTNYKRSEEKQKANYLKIIKSKSDNKDKVKEKINVQNRNQNLSMEKVNKTFFTNSLINDNISNNVDIHTKTEINDYSIKTKNINNLKYTSLKNQNNYKKDIIYPKKFINLNKRKNNSLENDHYKKKLNIDLTNLNNNTHYHNYSLITLFANQIKKDKNMDKMNKKIRNNSHNITASKDNKINLIKKNRFFSQERAKKFYKIKPNFNAELIKYKIKTNKSVEKTNDLKKDYKENIYFNNLKNNPSKICCKSSIIKIKEIIKKIFNNNLNPANKNNLIINTFNSNSSIILRCKVVNKLCNLYFELHVSFCKDSQKFVIIKPNLLSGNKLLFMKLFEKVRNELQN